MPTRTTCIVVALVLSYGAPSWVGKVPETPEQLRTNAQAIATGRVEGFRTEDVTDGDGSKTRYVHLEVVVESVEKGHDLLKGGETTDVRWGGSFESR